MKPAVMRRTSPSWTPGSKASAWPRAGQALCLLLWLGLQADVSAQTVFKCTGPNGGVVLQQKPCAGGQGIDVTPSTAPPTAEERAAAQRAADADRRAVDIAAGLSAGYPVVGMNLDQLAQVLGEPTRIDQAARGDSLQERRVYVRGGRVYTVHVDSGRVSAVRYRAAAGRKVSSAAAPLDCPTELDIRNLQTQASSIALSDAERRALQRRIRDMRACKALPP